MLSLGVNLMTEHGVVAPLRALEVA